MSRTAEQIINDESLWTTDKDPDCQTELCDACGQRMPVNMMTALFGVHFQCRGKGQEQVMKRIILDKQIANTIYNRGEKSKGLTKEEVVVLLDALEGEGATEGQRVVVELSDETLRHWITTLKSGKTGDYRKLAFELEGAFAAALGDALEEDLRWAE